MPAAVSGAQQQREVSSERRGGRERLRHSSGWCSSGRAAPLQIVSNALYSLLLPPPPLPSTSLCAMAPRLLTALASAEKAQAENSAARLGSSRSSRHVSAHCCCPPSLHSSSIMSAPATALSVDQQIALITRNLQEGRFNTESRAAQTLPLCRTNADGHSLTPTLLLC